MIFSKEYKEQWSLREKLLFRFVFSYLTLYILLLLTGFKLESPLRWFAMHILHWGGDFEVLNSGSGDRTFDYLRLAFNLILSTLVFCVWSVTDRKRPAYNQLFYWFLLLLRLTLFIAMLIYGLVKIFKGQFPDPTLTFLMLPVGDMSPMALAWTFMGHSLAYNIFIGFAEALGGLLMAFRRTTTLGALIVAGVMTNAAMMNLTFDIPVKLFSIHLVLMAAVLIFADRQRMVAVFLKNKVTPSIEYYQPLSHPGLKKFISFLKITPLVLMIAVTIGQCFVQFKMAEQLKKPVVYGIWEADLFIRGNDTIPPLITDAHRWRYLILDQREAATVRKMNETSERFEYEFELDEQNLTLYEQNGSIAHPFEYQLTDSAHLHMKGVFRGDSITLKLTKKPVSDFKLINRKFHWINEFPYQ
jgi:hypothetical protein